MSNSQFSKVKLAGEFLFNKVFEDKVFTRFLRDKNQNFILTFVGNHLMKNLLHNEIKIVFQHKFVRKNLILIYLIHFDD